MFIKLVSLGGSDMYVNMNLIEMIYHDERRQRTVLSPNSGEYNVRETPEQIMQLIKEAS